MRQALRSFASLVLVFGISQALAQAPQPLVRFTFDSSDEGWAGIGVNCRASVTTQSSFNGSGALKFDYDLRPKTMGFVGFQADPAKLQGVQTFRFWVRADQTTALGFIVQEKGGGRFTAIFAVPKGSWQKVEIAPEELVLNEGSDDPKDDNGRLDTDRIEAVAIGDLAQFIAQAGSSEFAALLGLELGSRTLLIDDFMATTEKLPPAVVATSTEVRLDTFVRPQVSWLATCPVSVAKGETGTPPALAATYKQAMGRIVALGRMVPKGTLKGMNRLSFTVSSRQRVMLVAQVEESGGGKFNTLVEVPEGSQAKPVTVEFSSLNPADDSAVKDRGVKAELINQVVFIDVTMMTGAVSDQENVLQIRDLKAAAGGN